MRAAGELSTDAASRRSMRVAAVVLLLAASVVYGLTTTTNRVNIDVLSASLGSWRIATTGSGDLRGLELAEALDRDVSEIFVAEAPNGELVAMRSPGAVAASVPAYWLAQPGEALEDYSITPQAVTAAVLTAATLALLLLALWPRAGRRTAILATIAYGFTTPAWSVSADGLWTHTITGLGIAGMAYAASRERWWLVGLFGGVALWGRLHAALVVAVVGLGVAWIRRQPRVAVAVGATSLPFIGLAAIWSRWLYGTWSPSGGYLPGGIASQAQSNATEDQGLGIAVNQLGLLVAPDRGILIWTPVVLILLPALVRSWRRLPDWSRWLLLGALPYTFVQAFINPFTGGDAFYGYRLTLELLTAATPAFAFSVSRAGRWARALLGPALALQFCVILTGAWSNGYYRPQEDAWTDNAFLHAIREEGAPLALVVLLSLAIGVLVARILTRTTREGLPESVGPRL